MPLVGPLELHLQASVQAFLKPEGMSQTESERILKGGSVHEHVGRLSDGGKKEIAERGDVVRLLEAVAGFH